MQTDYKEIKLHQFFDPIKKLFEFFILGFGFVGQKDFQKIFLNSHPELAPFVDAYNQEVNLKIEGRSVKSDAGLYWISVGRLMAIAIFDILQFSKYHNVLKNTEIFKFAKHIRNGAAHDNKFDLDPPLKNSICWRDKTIDNSMNNQKVFPDFMNPTTLIFLMLDISELIETKSKKS